jgi:hypothetical protein
MKKYLRCHTKGVFSKVGERYEITSEDERSYYVEFGSYTKEPDHNGKSYRDWFTLETDEQPREIDGRKAEVIRPGQRFSTYKQFAVKHGYPDAAAVSDAKDRRRKPQEGDIVTLLVSGEHHAGYRGETIWIVEAANSERYIIGEKGLRILSEELRGVTVFKDESFGGIEREYREIKRKADVGERIKITAGKSAMLGQDFEGEVFTVTHKDGVEVLTDGEWADGSTLNPAHEDYVVLEPTDIIRIDSERLRMVDRKAAVGERIIMTTSGQALKAGAVITVHPSANIDDGYIGYVDGTHGTGGGEFRVLEPVESAPLSTQPALDQAAANISALTAKVQALESRVTTLEKAKQPIKVAEGPADDAPPSFIDKPRAKPPQQIRDEIVERARADVKALLDRNYPMADGYHPSIWFTNKDGSYVTDKCEFIVNRDKRTVVALITTIYGSFCYRGIAKATPNDVFNAHIGRAIALRKALGLEIPAEYLSVPNPEESRVGDVVKATGQSAYLPGTSGICVKTEVDDGILYAHRHGGRSDGNTWAFKHDVSIIDDSRESVEEVTA